MKKTVRCFEYVQNGYQMKNTKNFQKVQVLNITIYVYILYMYMYTCIFTSMYVYVYLYVYLYVLSEKTTLKIGTWEVVKKGVINLNSPKMEDKPVFLHKNPDNR